MPQPHGMQLMFERIPKGATTHQKQFGLRDFFNQLREDLEQLLVTFQIKKSCHLANHKIAFLQPQLAT